MGLGRIWSFVSGFRSLVARLAPFKRESEHRGRIFWQRRVWISAPQWWDRKCEGRNEKCDFLARESVNSQQLCEFLAWESVNSSPILARQWWRHFHLSLFLSLSVPHAQYRKRFRASYNKSMASCTSRTGTKYIERCYELGHPWLHSKILSLDRRRMISAGERTSPLLTVRKNPKKRTRSDLEVDHVRPRRTMNTAQSSAVFMSMDTRGYIEFHH